MRRPIFLLAPLIGGCVSHGVDTRRPLEIATAPYTAVPNVAATGSLAYEWGCLLFRDDAHRAVWAPIWPDGTIFNGTALIFHQPGRADKPVVLDQEFLISGQPLAWSAVPIARAPVFERQCGGIPFAVADVRPAN